MGHFGKRLCPGGARYSFEINGCSSIVVIRSETTTLTTVNTDPPSPGADNLNGSSTQTDAIRFVMPIGSVLGFTIDDKHGQPRIDVMLKDGEASTSINSVEPVKMTITNWSPITFNNAWVPFVALDYDKPGAQDSIPHMIAALRHLVDVCREHPEQAPKDLF